MNIQIRISYEKIKYYIKRYDLMIYYLTTKLIYFI